MRRLPVLGALPIHAPARLPAPGAPLADAIGRRVDYLRISLTDRCNYRCTYCMPEEGVDLLPKSRVLTFEQLERLVRCFAELGVRRVRLTGGEPTIRRDLPGLVERLARIPRIDEITMTTNGELLAELAAPLRAAGLSRINVSVDSLDPDKFRQITRRGDLGRVLAGVDAACQAGFRSVKINTVAVKGFNDGEIVDLCRFAWVRGAVPRFIELMPMSEGTLFVPGELLPAARIREIIETAFPGSALRPAQSSAPGAGPAQYFRALSRNCGTPVGGTGEVGIISAITENFCSTCNRVRLNAVGELHTCLGHDDATDLRRALLLQDDRGQAEEAVKASIVHALLGKRAGHEFTSGGCGGPRKAMVSIGG